MTRTKQKSLKKSYAASHLKVCANCGSTEDIQLHHIVPLSAGGTDRESNLVYLCANCHKAVHGSKERWQYHAGKAGGRPRKYVLEEIEPFLLDYVNGERGKKETMELIGITSPQDLGMNGAPAVREFFAKYQIAKFINRIDLFTHGSTNQRRPLRNGINVGFVLFRDGTVLVNEWFGSTQTEESNEENRDAGKRKREKGT